MYSEQFQLYSDEQDVGANVKMLSYGVSYGVSYGASYGVSYGVSYDVLYGVDSSSDSVLETRGGSHEYNECNVV